MPLELGTVSFLFTDIEGSTRLWEEHANAMARALSRHDSLLRRVIAENGGSVFKTVGDSVCAAFETVPQALKAAVELQREILSESWLEPLGLRVRMALHAGVVEVRGDDYFGLPLSRLARILSTGHGGQILLSDAARDLARSRLPAEVTLQDLGSHRLRDLQQPERVWQVCHPALPARFPPLRSLDPERHNLPSSLSSFIGRERELAEIKRLMTGNRMLTLIGSGGCGKTRIALQAAADTLDDYSDGVWFVDLAPLADEALVPQTVATTLKVREDSNRSLSDSILARLADRNILLLFDNCEHLLPACASLVASVLAACPRVTILATSREPLALSGEQTFRVPSLSMPEGDRHTPEELFRAESARLFVDRACAASSTFTITEANAPAVARVCAQLDGIPLAIELAAARVRGLSVDQICWRLDDRFRLLTGGRRDALPRQQTLRALIDWSYDLLSPTEQVLLHRLSVFAGGWTLEAAEEICANDDLPSYDILDLLFSLVDKSLVLYEDPSGRARYRMLESVKQYAAEKLRQSGEAVCLRARHRDYFLRLSEEAAPHIPGAQMELWVERLATEDDNLRAALDCCLEEPEGARPGLRIAGALHRFWITRGYLNEGRERLAAVIAKDVAALPTIERGVALHGAGNMAYQQSDYDVARRYFEESLNIREAIGDRRGMAAALGSLGNCLQYQGDLAAARGNFEQSLAMNVEIGNLVGEATNLICLCSVTYALNDISSARPYGEKGLARARALGNRYLEISALNVLGLIAQNYDHDYGLARTHYEQIIALGKEVSDDLMVVSAQTNLGSVEADTGNLVSARVLHSDALLTLRRIGNQRVLISVLMSFADLEMREGHPERAVGLWGACELLRRTIGIPLAPNERGPYEEGMAAIRAAQSAETWDAWWSSGCAMNADQAIAFALEQE